MVPKYEIYRSCVSITEERESIIQKQISKELFRVFEEINQRKSSLGENNTHEHRAIKEASKI